mmetsp:Transcript_147360/g.260490  ORF Transcript_147360/g.260490 Transcript_147360/m.260490 type:complete len:626 (-) Transcript_147360:56-1933(-)
MAQGDAGRAALLEWVNSPEVSARVGSEKLVKSLDELGDGRALLRVMHDVAPDVFPDQDAVYMRCLLNGLVSHSRNHPGPRVQVARNLLERACLGGGCFDTKHLAELVQLVIFTALEPDSLQQATYVEACQQLSPTAQQAIMDIHQRFQAESDESPSLREHFDPPGRCGAQGSLDTNGLERRFRALQEKYSTLEEETETERKRFDDERAYMNHQLEELRQKRREAEDSEKRIREELRNADQVYHQVKEELRTVYDVEADRHAQEYQDHLQELQDELDIARGEATRAERMEQQLRECTKLLDQKVEDLRRQRDHNYELQVSNDRLLSSTQDGDVQNLQSRLDDLRATNAQLSRERDTCEDQIASLRKELEKRDQKQQELKTEMARLQRDGARQRSASPAHGMAFRRSPSNSQRVSNLAEEARQSLLGQQEETPPRMAAANSSSSSGGRTKPRPPPLPLDGSSSRGASPGVSKSPSNEKNMDLLERLLAEKERATRAETTLNMHKTQAESLSEQAARDAARIVALEEQVQSEAAQLQELKSRNVAEPQVEDGARVHELQAQLMQRDRELQVCRWRGQNESDALATQERLMASCFHELGLRYHKLRAEHELLKKQLRDSTKSEHAKRVK